MALNLSYQEKKGGKLVAAEDLALGTTISAYLLAVATTGDNAGKAYKASDTAGRRVIGIACTGSKSDGNIPDEGYFAKAGDYVGYSAERMPCLNNSATNALTNANIGDVCYVEDEITVCTSAGSTNSLIAGTVVAFTNSGQVVVDLLGAPYDASAAPASA